MMRTDDFDFELPVHLIARKPLKKRTASKLLVAENPIIDSRFSNLGDFLKPGDLLVLNDTKVVPARIFATKPSGAKVEILLEKIINEQIFSALLKTHRKPKIDDFLILENGARLKILNRQDDFWILKSSQKARTIFDQFGKTPLPPYIRRSANAQDANRYQTVFAENPGSVAAPTAGLHFDHALLTALRKKNIRHIFVTLHIGFGTFSPVRTKIIENHKMHREYCEIDEQTVAEIQRAKRSGGRIVAVGTTALRVLEAAAQSGNLAPFRGETDIFIRPGFHFQMVDKLVTNFHLPKSSLLMLAAAFVGRARILEIYRYAVTRQYRFFSYGDAMLLAREI